MMQDFTFTAQPPSLAAIAQHLQLNSGLEVVTESEFNAEAEAAANMGFACGKERLEVSVHKEKSIVSIHGHPIDCHLITRLGLVITALGGVSKHPSDAPDLAFTQPITAAQLQTSERWENRKYCCAMVVLALFYILISPVLLLLMLWFLGKKAVAMLLRRFV